MVKLSEKEQAVNDRYQKVMAKRANKHNFPFKIQSGDQSRALAIPRPKGSKTSKFTCVPSERKRRTEARNKGGLRLGREE